ncbi:MAG: hypothetical protein P4L40_25720 [Terracidiphilus sp.]|nr:hypothetical protein [Terracidiphilus sp.]
MLVPVVQVAAPPSPQWPLVSSSPLCGYSAHAMGTNALTAVCVGGRAFIASGGDDQSLCVSVCAFEPPGVATHVFRYPGVAVAALTGVWTDGRVVVACGVDQRLTVWRVCEEALAAVRGASSEVVVDVRKGRESEGEGKVSGEGARKGGEGLLQLATSAFTEVAMVSGLSVTPSR